MDTVHEYNREYIELEVNDLSRTGYLLEEKLEIKNYKIVSKNKMRIYDIDKNQNIISRLIIENGIELESIGKKESTLEEYFLQLTQEDTYDAIN